jgi:hypothetical protein
MRAIAWASFEMRAAEVRGNHGAIVADRVRPSSRDALARVEHDDVIRDAHD